MEWYDWIAYVFIAAGVYLIIVKRIQKGGR
ncbi:hypothetical protein AHMF7616_03248 [Adhaeribacter pallidiroseus]|uniref:Uncharacterized protein n=1 Tax=Adhaeribacter pallidiroseus TaxID=2072847 RepID=A0A369QJR5_9BACT|nr:hypothetical protein AHMF7616_03248 [Adhaeribacter pallidiroseus]